ncbi:hypothetical protein QQS21_012712 [Conoideocrella luteorostrata]|uniref:Uncharacterized protein n=1 Tax=Conoideocrella luteorostrata TaxID=1105319 RepID=A0AAJ0CDE1_9HYPO|nr:hypothetical protein QQS21_012712 [Conoideocrella luteorostrata]
MSLENNGNNHSVKGDLSQRSSKRLNGKSNYSCSDECAKPPLPLLEPQETWVPDMVSIARDQPRVETPRAVSPTVSATVDDNNPTASFSFPLESYLNDDNELEKQMMGITENSCACTGRYTTPPAARLESEEPHQLLPAVWAAAADDGTDATVQELLSPNSWPTPPSAQPSVSSTFSSDLTLQEHPLLTPSVAVRHSALHRQLVEAGFSGLDDSSNTGP